MDISRQESKNSQNVIAPLVEPNLVADIVPNESDLDMSESGGMGRGRGDASGNAPPKAWQQDGGRDAAARDTSVAESAYQGAYTAKVAVDYFMTLFAFVIVTSYHALVHKVDLLGRDSSVWGCDIHGAITPKGHFVLRISLEEPILDQAPVALVGFAPQWIGGQIPDNNNGWLEEDPDENEDPEEEPEEEEIEDEDMVNDDEDDAEVINPYKEADPHNRPPPTTSDEETEFAPPVVEIDDADDVSIPHVIRFGSNFWRKLSHDAGNSEVYALGPMEFTELKNQNRRAKELNRWEAWVRGRIPNNLRFQEEPSIYTAPVSRADDPYVMVRDAAMDTQGDEDVDTDA
nr:transcription initiation factor TFIID subunit 15-like isoform X2 [Tanacetum cinerariifolium]